MGGGREEDWRGTDEKMRGPESEAASVTRKEAQSHTGGSGHVYSPRSAFPTP